MNPYVTIIPQNTDLDISRKLSTPAFAIIESTSPEGKGTFKDFSLVTNLTAAEVATSTAFDGWMTHNHN
jgi:hypothetical protein